MTIALNYDRRNTWGLVLVCPVLVIVGLVFAVSNADSPTSFIIASVFIVIGIGGFVIGFQRMGDRGVVLRIDRDGILDRRLARQPIRWDQIIAIEAKKTDCNVCSRYLDLHVHRSAPVHFGLQVVLWRLAGCRGFPISDDGLDGSFNEILLAAKHFADRERVPMRV